MDKIALKSKINYLKIGFHNVLAHNTVYEIKPILTNNPVKVSLFDIISCPNY